MLSIIIGTQLNNKDNKIEESNIVEPSTNFFAYTLNGENTKIDVDELISNYSVNSITCENGSIITWDYSINKAWMEELKPNDKCTIDFTDNSFVKGTLAYKMLEDNPARETRTDFSTTFTENTTGTIYMTTEKNVHNTTDTTVYYYAGNTTNNWVYFAGFYWRIIRTNADGSVRLLYHGTSTDTTSAYIGSSAFNSSYDHPRFVGYKYGTTGSLDNIRTNNTDSTIKGVIDTWYSNNLANYSSYLSITAVFCNDRNLQSGSSYSDSSSFNFAVNGRLYTSKTPTYDCTNEYDAFSSSSDNTKAKLTYPIALMTADEIVYAGGIYGLNNASAWYYLNSASGSSTGSNWWWLLSPRYWTSNIPIVLFVHNSSNLGKIESRVDNAKLVRPVVSVNSNFVVKSGDGTASDPYAMD